MRGVWGGACAQEGVVPATRHTAETVVVVVGVGVGVGMGRGPWRIWTRRTPASSSWVARTSGRVRRCSDRGTVNLVFPGVWTGCRDDPTHLLDLDIVGQLLGKGAVVLLLRLTQVKDLHLPGQHTTNTNG